MVNPLVTQQIKDLTVNESSEPTTIDLTATFDDPSTTGQIARFEFADNINNGGVVDVLLFDQDGVGAPATVENFLNYVEDEDYDDSIIHRSIPGFIIQGGGFEVTDSRITSISADDPVANEFSLERSNVRGTIAMAKLEDNPDSATNGWFFNLVDNNDPDNPLSLDNQNGGFTAFGEVISDEGLETVDAIADLTLVDGDPPPARTLDNLPVTDTTEPINTEDLVYLESVTSLSEDELEYSVSNSNEELVEASIADGELTLDYVDGQTGDATITLEATNLLGESVEEAFVVTVEETPEEEIPVDETPVEELENPVDETPVEEEEIPVDETPVEEEEIPVDETPVEEEENPVDETPVIEIPVDETPVEELENPVDETPVGEIPDLDPIGSTVFRFLDPDTGVHFYANSQAERDELLADEPDYIAEDLGYRNVDPSTSGAQSVFSFFNEDTGAYLYTTDENERDFIEDNLDNYAQEDDSFSVFTEEQENTIPIYRFLNTSTGAHFYTPSESEKTAIEDGLSNYESEGIAFYAFDAGE